MSVTMLHPQLTTPTSAPQTSALTNTAEAVEKCSGLEVTSSYSQPQAQLVVDAFPYIILHNRHSMYVG